MLIDSESAKHITSHASKVLQKKASGVCTILVGDKTVLGSHSGIRMAMFHATYRKAEFSLSKILPVRKAGMSLLSISPLARMKIGKLSLRRFAILYDILDECSVLDLAERKIWTGFALFVTTISGFRAT